MKCPGCGSEDIKWFDPVKIDEEIDQVLLSQFHKCRSCGFEWVERFWEVWTPAGIKIVTLPFSGGQDEMSIL